MDASESKVRFERIWRCVARFDTQPQLKIALDDRDARRTIESSLATYVGDDEIWLDSPALENRPLRLRKTPATGILALHPKEWEFVVLRDEGDSYWAITEEEHDWLVFTANEEKA